MVDSTTTNRAVVPAKVSIIIVNYNCMKDIDVCLSSVLAQTYPDYEVIFVDNNSTDGSLEHARSKFPSVTFMANSSNLGWAVGINSALPCATGEFIAPLNIDTEVAPGWLAVMVDFLRVHPRTGAVTPKILLFDDRRRINAKGHNVHCSGLSFCRDLYKLDDGSVSPEKVSGVSGCSYLIRRETLERIGGLPADSFMSNDDVVVSWLLHLMGDEIYCVPEAVVYHKYQLKMDPGKLFRLEKDREKLVLSSLKPTTLLVCAPVFLAIECMIMVYSVGKGRKYAGAKLAATVALWQERRGIGERRRQYRGLRRVSDTRLLGGLRWGVEWQQLLHI
jgi:GT2 family glycosyltransferase